MPLSPPKEKSEDSRLLVFLYAVVMAAFGVFLGMIYLMSFPLEAYSSLKERGEALEGRESLDPIPGDAFYIEGPILRTRGWELKREQFINGSAGTIRVSPGEINAWFASNFRAATPSTEKAKSDFTLSPKVPNLGFSEAGTVYLNLPADISVYGIDGHYVLSAHVRYAEGAPARLVVEHLRIAGARIPFPRVLGSRIVSRIVKGFSSAEEYILISKAWNRVESVEFGENELLFTLDTP